MTRAWRLVVGVACAWCSVARADVVKLADLEARAMSQRPEIAASTARIRAAGAEIAAAESTYYPQVSASIDGSLAPGRKLIELPGTTYLVSASQTLSEGNAFQPHPRYGASVAARGTLYDFGRTRSALDAAKAKQRASQADANARAQLLVLEVRAAYLRWSVAQELWQIAKQAEADAKTRSDRVAGLIAEGAAPPSAATAASTQANVAATESERAELELESARLELSYLSARDLGPAALPEPSFLAVSAQPTAAMVSGPLGPIAVTAHQAPAGVGQAGEPDLAAKYLQPAAAGGPPPGPAGVQPSAAPAVPPPSPAGSPQPSAAPLVTPPRPATASPLAPDRVASDAAVASPAPASGSLQPSAADTAAESSPQLAALETARAAAEAARRMQSRMSAPALGYRFSAGIEGQDAKAFPVYGFGVGLTIPLWDGGATSAAEAGARAGEAELSAELDAERARDKHLRSRRRLQIEHANRLLALAENAVALAETRVQQVMEGPTLATAEQQALAAAETERTRSRADLIRAKAARVQLQLGL